MTLNRHEFSAMKDLADHLNLDFRFDAAIFPCFNGDQSPVRLRVSPGEAVEREFRDGDTFRLWKKYYEKTRGAVVSNDLYQCGTGISTFHIDPYGNLQPCQLVNEYSFNLRNGSFNKGWQEKISQVNEQKAGSRYKCNHCERMSLCGLCPAFFELETGSAQIYSEYLCEMGHEREKRLQA
jgi:radical SAM protein with 4Fe4S-binding SPASM domain